MSQTTINPMMTSMVGWAGPQATAVSPDPGQMAAAAGTLNSSMTAKSIVPDSLRAFLSSAKAIYPEADIAFLVYAMQIRNMDESMSHQLKLVEAQGDLRKLYSSKLDDLRTLLTNVTENKGEDSSISDKDLQAKCAWWAEKSAAERAELLTKREFTVGKDGEIVAGEKQGWVGKERPGDPNGAAIDLNSINDYIKELTGKLQEVDSDREIKMIMLNQTLNKKGEAVNQLTGMMKTTNNTRNSVINNLR